MSDYCTVKINMHDLALCTVYIYMYGLFSCIYLHVRPIFLFVFTCTVYFPVDIYMYGLYFPVDIYMYGVFFCRYLHVRPIFLYLFTCTAYFPVYIYLHIRPIVNVLKIFTCTTFQQSTDYNF